MISHSNFLSKQTEPNGFSLLFSLLHRVHSPNHIVALSGSGTLNYPNSRLRLKVKRRQSVETHTSSFDLPMARARNVILVTGLVAFAATGMAFPFYMALSGKKKPVIDSSKPLPPQATFRGPYINTGSRDVGPDYKTYPKK